MARWDRVSAEEEKGEINISIASLTIVYKYTDSKAWNKLNDRYYCLLYKELLEFWLKTPNYAYHRFLKRNRRKIVSVTDLLGRETEGKHRNRKWNIYNKLHWSHIEYPRIIYVYVNVTLDLLRGGNRGRARFPVLLSDFLQRDAFVAKNKSCSIREEKRIGNEETFISHFRTVFPDIRHIRGKRLPGQLFPGIGFYKVKNNTQFHSGNMQNTGTKNTFD